MKSYFGLAIILCLSQLTVAQSVNWTTGMDKIVYIGINNILPLEFKDISPEEVRVHAATGKIILQKDGQYSWKVSRKGLCRLEISMGDKLLTSFEVDVQVVPSPKVVFLPHDQAIALNFKGIAVEIPKIIEKAPTVVYSYRVSFLDSETHKEIYHFDVQGALLSKEQRKILKKTIHSESTIWLRNIKVRFPGDAADRRMPDKQLQ